MFIVKVPDFVFLYVLTGNDQADCSPEPSLLQRNTVSNLPAQLKTESPEPAAFNNQVLMLLDSYNVINDLTNR